MAATLIEHECWVGDTRRLSCKFEAGTAAVGDPTSFTYAADDPDTVRLTLTSPSGTVTTLVYGTDAALVRHTEGWFYVDYTFATAGVWTAVWAGTGVVAALAVVRIRVQTLPL